MPNLVIFRGLPGSGKTTLAKERCVSEGNTLRVNKDDLRSMGFDSHWTAKREKLIFELEQTLAIRALSGGYNVIVDDTNLNPRILSSWKELAKGLEDDIHVSVEDIKTPLDECIRRDSMRKGKARVGRAVIENMALRYGRIEWDERPIVIFDIDGTLANIDHRLSYVQKSPKDWAGFYSHVMADKVNTPIADWLEACRKDMQVVICSGRPTYFGNIQLAVHTEWWLDVKHIQYDHLFMRQDHDHRVDSEVKQDILNLLPKDKIAFVVDDRKQVVDMWRKNGLKVYQIGEGNY